MDTAGDHSIKQVKPDSEREILCFLSFVVPRFYVTI